MPSLAVPADYSTIEDAINAASNGDVINIAAGSYSVNQLTLTSKGLTLIGAGKTNTIITCTGGGFGVLITHSNTSIQDLRINVNNTNTNFVCSVSRNNVNTDVSNILFSNVMFNSVNKGVAVNGVSNVSFTGCVFPQTAGYSIGLASVKGCNLQGCTIPSSLYGSVGIFPSTFYLGLNPSFDATSRNIDLSGNTFTGPNNSDAGVIQVQPGSGPAITYGFLSENVKLPTAFKYAYLQKTVNTSNNSVVAGSNSTSISNYRFFGTLGPVNTPGTGAYYHAALQSFAPSGYRIAIYGHDLSNGSNFTETAFNAADATSQPSSSTTVTELSSIVNSTLGPITVNTSQATVQAAISQVVATATNSSVPKSSTLAALIVRANADAATSNYTTKSAIAAELAGNASFQNITLSTADRDAVIASIPSNKKGASVSNYSWVARFPESGCIKMPTISSSSALTYIPAMNLNQEYTLLLESESSQPAGQPISKVKYDGTNILFSRSDINSGNFVTVSIGNMTTIQRDMTMYEYPVYAVGSFGAGSNGSTITCIPEGQRILTPGGWKAVEILRNGDLVITDKNTAVVAKIYSTTIKTTSKTAPITIPTNLFGNNLPSMPVRLSPLHAVRTTKGVWDFPFSLLHKHGSVTQDEACEEVTYYHIELPNFLRDNLVLEGGLVAESYGAKYIKANHLNGKKLYTYSTRLGGYTRITESYIKASKKSV